MRHGRPAVDGKRRLSAREYGDWLRDYDAAAIDQRHPPPRASQILAETCHFAVCSDLRRSRESLDLLGTDAPMVSERMFREMEMPYAQWRFPRFTIGFWSIFFRLIWVLGFASHAESFPSARKRAADCADRLIGLAEQHGDVLFVGHGSLNWFIARQLHRQAWRSNGRAPRRHWQTCVFEAPPGI